MDKIKIVGARTHNLKNITVEIPREKITVITGLSGSGKSSLAFDTIYAEGQRRYVENLSTYARQFFGVFPKPDIDFAEGLVPAIAIDQKSVGRSPRSTVGTLTEIYDFLRLLFARLGTPYCPGCNKPMVRNSVKDVLAQIKKNFCEPKVTPDKVMVLATQVEAKKGQHKHIFEKIIKQKFNQVRLDGKFLSASDVSDLDLDPRQPHTIEVVVGEFETTKLCSDHKVLKDFAQAIQKAFLLGEGFLTITTIGGKKDTIYSRNFTCLKCAVTLPDLQPRLFSFNSPAGACPACHGLGHKKEVDPDLVVPNPRLTLAEGAIRPWARMTNQSSWYDKILTKLSHRYKFSLDVPVRNLPRPILKILMYGDAEFEGILKNLERRYHETDSEYLRAEIEKYMVERICLVCRGQRLRNEALQIKFLGKNIVELSAEPVNKLLQFFMAVDKSANHGGQLIVEEIISRLENLQEVGLGYLTLERSSETLAGGEAQRIRLATQLSSALSGILYVLDEPTIGLHPYDREKLVQILKLLRDKGNTVIVVEHDDYIMNNADFILDIGPGAGGAGGRIVARGTPADIKKSSVSLTGKYLLGKKKTYSRKKLAVNLENALQIRGAAEFNLKNVDVKIPLGAFVCITGVSGSGKSTLIYEILGKALAQKFHRAQEKPGKHRSITGTDNIDKVIKIDQSPIGRTPRSNLATYTGLFTPIRELFADQPEAKIKGFGASHFSFNLRGGRCENCHGDGSMKVEMYFLPDVYVTCEECKGQRYNEGALSVYWKDKNIADVLALDVDQAYQFFRDQPQILEKLVILRKVGLGYVPLGQSATTLSGGEAQRIKLATELSRHDTGRTLYILDEPTTGLHFEDISCLLKVLDELVKKGNTVLVIEHNLDMVGAADWIIDLGPGGGTEGGEVVAEGTPAAIAKNKNSLTGKYLRAK